ncbi:thioesterase family protein [Pseudofrankia sp. BMG5.36]|uniref:thioesterase family protein n=1 Tax=Pseudofrankia sp. BMG5.36 TaxID=1834512 RepID=UPI0009F643E7|nr:thioesterase family protein [Pseudofrankia sp. BMG5.36]
MEQIGAADRDGLVHQAAGTAQRDDDGSGDGAFFVPDTAVFDTTISETAVSGTAVPPAVGQTPPGLTPEPTPTPTRPPIAAAAGGTPLRATSSSEGPWAPGLQHGGVVSAVLTRSLEQTAEAAGLTGGHLARIAVEFLRPAPVGPVSITAEVVRPGRQVALLRAELRTGPDPASRVLAVATAWWRRRSPGLVPDIAHTEAPTLPDPDTLPTEVPDSDLTRYLDRGYIAATEWRYAGGRLEEPGSSTAWVRPRVPLVHGEPISPAQLLMLVADAASGVSAVLDFRTHLFTNVDLVVSALRPIEGDWVSLHATTAIDGAGGGTTTTMLGDRRGPVAFALHTLFVAPLVG